MFKLSKFLFIFATLFSQLALTETKIPKGKITSPYEACKSVLILEKDKYLDNKKEWDAIEKKCHFNIQLSESAGLSKLDPLKEGVEYLALAEKVAHSVLTNLDKNKEYVECSKKCFSGAKVCEKTSALQSEQVQCSQRINEVKEGMKVYSRKIRMELALSDDAPGIVNINIRNVNSQPDEKMVNSNLRDFEIGVPNPVGRMDLTEREKSVALKKVKREKKLLEEEAAKLNANDQVKYDWLSIKMMERFDQHRERYRQLVYEEAPIFAVVDQPVRYVKDSDPEWSDEQLAKAFGKLSENIDKTKKKVNWSLKNGKLEFSRDNFEALGKWFRSITPGVDDQQDLLFYMGMKNQVEEVLKKNPSYCGAATAISNRIFSKDMQNLGVTFVGSMMASGGLRLVSGPATNVFRIGRALTGAEAAGMTGMAMGSGNLMNSFAQYSSTSSEASTKSGLGGASEGSAIRSSEEVESARSNITTSVALLPVDAIGGYNLRKSLYSKLSRRMEKDMPEIAGLIKRGRSDDNARDTAVEKWILMKIRLAVQNGELFPAEVAALKNKNSRETLEMLTAEIEKKNPDFFKNPKNFNFFLKTAAATVKKEADDPSDLGKKAEQLLLKFNTQAMDGSWDPKAQSGLLKVYDAAIEELRLSSKKDPATYAKFSTDVESQQKIMLRALKRSGVEKEDEAASMLQCALRR